jgi:hypothetical protein
MLFVLNLGDITLTAAQIAEIERPERIPYGTRKEYDWQGHLCLATGIRQLLIKWQGKFRERRQGIQYMYATQQLKLPGMFCFVYDNILSTNHVNSNYPRGFGLYSQHEVSEGMCYIIFIAFT